MSNRKNIIQNKSVKFRDRVRDLVEQALALHRQGNYLHAINIYKKILIIHPDNFEVLFLYGVAALETESPDLTVELTSKVVQLNPFFSAAYSIRGQALMQLNRLTEAIECYGKVVEIEPNNADGYYDLGIVLKMSSRNLEAIAMYERAIALKPDFSEAYFNRGNALKELNRLAEAVSSYESAVLIRNDFHESRINMGNCYKDMGLYDKALECYDRLIELIPDYAEAYSNRGLILHGIHRLNDAVIDFNRAIDLNPKYAEAFSNLGNSLKDLNYFGDALLCYEEAIRIKPDYVEGYANMGLMLQEFNRPKEAIACYDQALALKPGYAVAEWNKSLSLLMEGNYSEGWKLYESRWRLSHVSTKFGEDIKKKWDGSQNLSGKTILLYSEQGLGDTIQFCRYAKSVKALGATVLLIVQKPLFKILLALEGVDKLLLEEEPLPDFDYFCALMSLPSVLGTTLDTVPSPFKYLYSPIEKNEYWRKKVGVCEKVKVGIVWNGGFRADQPELWSVNARRNIELEIFSSHLQNVDVIYYSLQKGEPAESEIKEHGLKYWPSRNFLNYADELNDFSDTAALVEQLDLVISVDTSTAHLAAALGKPTWILSRFDSCWRWLLNRSDSPWYDSVRIYRQDESRDWRPVLKAVAFDLVSLSNRGR